MHPTCTQDIKAEADYFEVEGGQQEGEGRMGNEVQIRTEYMKYKNVIIKQLFYILSKITSQKKNIAKDNWLKYSFNGTEMLYLQSKQHLRLF